MGKVNLCIDIGNTSTKAAVFKDGKCLKHFSNFTRSQFNQYKKEVATILACQSGPTNAISLGLKDEEKLTYLTPLPITLDYETPESLGMDRLAAGVACAMEFKDKTIVKVDLGTCLTMDLVKNHTFCGGLIAPGIEMRLKAMHEFTAALPIVPLDTEPSFPGKSTFQSMQVGAYRSAIHEICGYIRELAHDHDDIIVVDCSRYPIDFAKDLKMQIFARPKNTLVGLNHIIEHNVK